MQPNLDLMYLQMFPDGLKIVILCGLVDTQEKLNWSELRQLDTGPEVIKIHLRLHNSKFPTKKPALSNLGNQATCSLALCLQTLNCSYFY